MRSIRQLDTNLKLYAVFGVLTSLTTLLVLWMLGQLSQMHELSVNPGKKLSQSAADMQANYALARIWVGISISAILGVAVLLALWIKAEVARPVDLAVAMARRVAEGDLSTRGGDGGLLLRTMQDMNDRLVNIIVKVRGGTESIASGAADIASGSMDLSARTEEQAASLEETATSMEQLTATVKQNADHAHQASKLAVSASEVAVKGGEVVAEVVGTMASINDSSTRIAEIIGVIDGIAFQTNILALNAAVEAARAGEQGRGFAVVAAEVRSLARRSAAAAKEIKVLIDDSVEKVSAGTLLADKAGKTMHEVVTSVKRVTDIIGEIANASAEQTVGIEQVNKAIVAMDQATQHNAALVESSAAAAAAMRDQAGSLSRLLGAFSLGPDHAKPAAQIHLVANNPNKLTKPRADAKARAKIAPVRAVAVRTGGTAAKPVDWEEF
ncbi:MAG: methyl-accepting chemotaxis protein [Pseudomonadota bacterium]